MEKEKKVYSHLDTYMKRLWQVSAEAFFVAIFLCVRLEIEPPPIMLLIGGLALISGYLIPGYFVMSAKE